MADMSSNITSLSSMVDATTGLNLDSTGWLLVFKALAALGAGVICFMGALIPTRLVALLKGRGNVLSYANCLGAGILLGASFVHLLTDAEDTEEGGADRIELPPYFTHMVAGVGFLLSFSLEKVIFGHGHSHAHLPDSDSHHHHHDPSHGDVHHHNHDVELEELGSPLEEDTDDGHGHGHGHSHGGDEHIDDFDASDLTEAEQVMVEEESGHGHSHGHGHGDGAVKEGPKRFPYILFVILGIESVVSGSALGVQETASKVLVVWLAIITHIWAESFTLCVGVLKSGLTEPVTLGIMALYSTLTPIGILLGVISMLFLSQAISAVVSAILVAFAAGCFLYVATLEIIVEEFEAEKGRLFKLVLLLIGFIFMCVLVLFF